MPDTKFQDALNFFWRPENDGQPFHNTRGDAGGATSWGVTWGTWCAWRQLHDNDGVGGSMAEFTRMQRDAFQPFYRSGFWNPVCGDALPAGVGLLVFDAAGMSGVSRASRWLQRVVGTTQDGAIGPRTLAAVAAGEAKDIIDRFTAVRSDFYYGLANDNANDARFLTGWLRRARDGQVAALAASIADAARPEAELPGIPAAIEQDSAVAGAD